jgi:hypothetical protein
MHGYLKEHSGAFGPDEVRTLIAAFDKAWESVQARGAIFDTDAAAEIARAVLAKQIIEAAKQGERDQGRLRDGALVALARSNLQSAKRPLRQNRDRDLVHQSRRRDRPPPPSGQIQW